MSTKAELKALIKTLERNGWTVVQGVKHYKANHPKGGFVSMSVSPSDNWAIKNMIGDINRLHKQNTGEKLI